MSQAEGKARACALLCEKHTDLLAQGLDRLPHRSDFTAEEVVLIKAYLGPFPRALEAAGLKAPRSDDRTERQREKRIAAKRKRTAAKKAAIRQARTEAGEQEQKP